MSDKQPFDLVTNYQPAGDQPQAIEKLVQGIEQGYHDQLLLGVTGSGKTYTMANVIARTQRPTIVMAKRWQRSCMVSLKRSFRTTQSNILSVIMTIISLKPMYHLPILLLKKMRLLMIILTKCDSRPHVLC